MNTSIKYYANYMSSGGTLVVMAEEEEDGRVSLVQAVRDVFEYSREQVNDLLRSEGWLPAQGGSYDWVSRSEHADGSWVGHWEAPVKRQNERRGMPTSANLTSANLTRADLTGADLTYAALTGAVGVE